MKGVMQVSVIKNRRLELRLTREQLAKKLNVNPYVIVRWENGQAPKLQHLPIIYKVMKLNYKTLVEDYKEA